MAADVVAADVAVAVGETMLKSFPTLGVGMGFRPPYLADLFRARPQVDFLEITADHYLDVSEEKQRELELLADHFTLIPHGLDLSLGSAEGIDPRYVDKLARLVEKLNPPWWSEHIAFTHAAGIVIGHLAPLPFNYEAVDIIARNVEQVQRVISTPLILENISSPLIVPGGEMDEAEFLHQVLDSTHCGLLCDVTNLYTNAINYGADLPQLIENWPWDRVVQLHLAGGHWSKGRLIDSHAHSVPEEVWTLLDEVLARAPVRGIILERDECLPPFGELLSELKRARDAGKRLGRWD